MNVSDYCGIIFISWGSGLRVRNFVGRVLVHVHTFVGISFINSCAMAIVIYENYEYCPPPNNDDSSVYLQFLVNGYQCLTSCVLCVYFGISGARNFLVLFLMPNTPSSSFLQKKITKVIKKLL